MFHKLSIIIPTFNEARSIGSVLQNVANIKLINGLLKEIIVIDDQSTDNTECIVNEFNLKNSVETTVVYFKNLKNLGKGACIRKGIKESSGDIIIIQDADFEYQPADYNKLLRPICEGHADVVYGSRFIGDGPHRVLFFFHTIGNKLLTFLSNLLTQLNLTDMETGYKMFKADILKQINLKEDRFGFEPEVTAKISRIKHIRIYEVGISYYGRTYQEGKKINWKDGCRAIFCILKYNIFQRK